MKTQWLLLISLVSSISHTKWVEIKGADKTPQEADLVTRQPIVSMDLFEKKLTIGTKNNIWVFSGNKPFKWENNKWILKDIMKNPNEKNTFSDRHASFSIRANVDGSVYIGVLDTANNVYAIYEWDGTAWNKAITFNKASVITMDTIGKNNFVLLTVSVENGQEVYSVYQGDGKEWRTLNNSKEDPYFPTSNISAGSDGTLYGIMFPITKEFVFDVARWNGKLWGRIKTPQFDTKNIPKKNLQIIKHISVGNKNNIWLIQYFSVMGETREELALYDKLAGNRIPHIYKYSPTDNKFKEIPNELGIYRICAGKDGITTWAMGQEEIYQWVE